MKKNFTSGPIFKPMLIFVLPIMLNNILQTMYNIADNIIVGKFSGDTLALAAVGTSGAISTLFLNLVIGLSVGSSVAISQAFGANDQKAVTKGTHTALTFGFFAGVVLSIFSIIFADDMLRMIGTDEVILGRATLYLRIIFAALPATAVYNFAAAVLRAVGDSRTSLIILTTSGIINVILNIFFVSCFGMAADGVALATAISKVVSAVWIVAVLKMRSGEVYGLHFKRLGINGAIFKRMLRLGLPTAIQNSMFSLSNIFLTGALNSLKHTYLLTARAIALNLSSLANNISSSYMNALVTFSGQNYGAKKYPRLKRCLLIGIVQSCIITIFICSLSILFVKPISMLYVSDSDPQKLLILDAVRLVTITILPPYFIASIMNVLSGLLRGMGYSVTPMLSSIVGVCLLRIVWIYTAFTHVEKLHTIWGLYLCFPITWTVTCVFLSIILFVAWKRLKKQQTLTLSNL